MQNIIKIKSNIIGADEVNSVNARELWTALESKRHFADWIKNRLVRFTENVDYISISQKNEIGNKPLKEYILTIDTAKMIAMLENNIKGDEVRKYFIECEKQLNKPQTYEEIMQNALLLADKKVKELENKIIEMKPHADFGKAIGESATAVKIGDYIKVLNENGQLKMGRNKTFKWLRAENYLQKDNMPYQRYIDQGLFEVKENLIVTTKGNIVRFTTLLTGKGQQFFSIKLLGK